MTIASKANLLLHKLVLDAGVEAEKLRANLLMTPAEEQTVEWCKQVASDMTPLLNLVQSCQDNAKRISGKRTFCLAPDCPATVNNGGDCASCKRWLCTVEMPAPAHTRSVHPYAYEIADYGDTARLECPVCGVQWTTEIPQ